MSRFILSESKWNHSEARGNELDLATDLRPTSSVLDDIINRVSNLTESVSNVSSVESSFDLNFYSQQSFQQVKETTAPRVNWTVAPKIFSVKSSKTDNFTPVFVEPKTWTKSGSDLRPIGTKSASMTTVRNVYQSRCQAGADTEEPKSVGETLSSKENGRNVWQHEKAEKDIFKESAFSGISQNRIIEIS